MKCVRTAHLLTSELLQRQLDQGTRHHCMRMTVDISGRGMFNVQALELGASGKGTCRLLKSLARAGHLGCVLCGDGFPTTPGTENRHAQHACKTTTVARSNKAARCTGKFEVLRHRMLFRRCCKMCFLKYHATATYHF